MAVGRDPCTNELNLDRVGVRVNQRYVDNFAFSSLIYGVKKTEIFMVIIAVLKYCSRVKFDMFSPSYLFPYHRLVKSLLPTTNVKEQLSCYNSVKMKVQKSDFIIGRIYIKLLVCFFDCGKGFDIEVCN